jgi:inosine/guanosine/xanthosine phosphorylase family protein
VNARAQKVAAAILRSSPWQPRLAVVLGSGFHAVQQSVEAAFELPYTRLPGFLPTQVDGHCGKLVIGSLGRVPLLLLCGRSHYYEGHSMAEITFPIRVLAECGIHVLLLTNAAGGINPRYRPGDFMCVTDHLNFMGANPLRGQGSGSTMPFVDLCGLYDPSLTKLLARAARQERVRCHHGVYLAVPGPSYETPAEIRAFARLGADAVGMSTVPEAIVARNCRLRVAGLSCITNRAAAPNGQAICHAEVLRTGAHMRKSATAILTRFLQLTTEAGLERVKS